MAYLNTPLSFVSADSSVILNRDIEDQIQMLDNFVELIVFTPRGSFASDPDFGFEYWNHEYSNIHFRNFNNGHLNMLQDGRYNDITKKECQDSILNCLAAYQPQLKQADVQIELNAIDDGGQERKKVMSKYYVTVKVTGSLDDGLGVMTPYYKEVVFLMEPTVKKFRI